MKLDRYWCRLVVACARPACSRLRARVEIQMSCRHQVKPGSLVLVRPPPPLDRGLLCTCTQLIIVVSVTRERGKGRPDHRGVVFLVRTYIVTTIKLKIVLSHKIDALQLVSALYEYGVRGVGVSRFRLGTRCNVENRVDLRVHFRVPRTRELLPRPPHRCGGARLAAGVQSSTYVPTVLYQV